MVSRRMNFEEKRSQYDRFSMEKGVTPLCGLLGEWRMENGECRNDNYHFAARIW